MNDHPVLDIFFPSFGPPRDLSQDGLNWTVVSSYLVTSILSSPALEIGRYDELILGVLEGGNFRNKHGAVICMETQIPMPIEPRGCRW